MYFFTLARLYDGNLIHLMKWYGSDMESLKRKVGHYESDVATISRFDDSHGEFIPVLIREPRSREWTPARNANLLKLVKSAAKENEMNEPEQKTYFILRDLDGYGSEYPVCVDRQEAERLMREWYNPDDAPEFDAVWAEASEEEIAKYGRYDTDTDAETLQELTGQESGIVIYTSDEMIICNWAQYGPNELPKIFAGITVMGWDEGENIFDGAEENWTEDYRPLLGGRDLIWDQLDDMSHIANPDTDPAWFRASVYTLKDGTIIIAPQMWN